LDDVASDLEERGVDVFDRVRPREHEVVVAALEARAAEVRGRELERLDARAHRAVVDEDALLEGLEVAALAHDITRNEKAPLGHRAGPRSTESATLGFPAL